MEPSPCVIDGVDEGNSNFRSRKVQHEAELWGKDRRDRLDRVEARLFAVDRRELSGASAPQPSDRAAEERAEHPDPKTAPARVRSSAVLRASFVNGAAHRLELPARLRGPGVVTLRSAAIHRQV
jgi:hypothetical protein